MHIILKLVSSGRPRRMVIRAGQIVRVGSTEWADLCIPDDPDMAEEHFSVECAPDGCRIRSLGGATTSVNDEAVEDHVGKHGDRIVAGRSEFKLEFPDAAQDQGANGGASDVEESTEAPVVLNWPNLATQDWPALFEQASVKSEAADLFDEANQADQYASRLMAEGMTIEALKLLAHALPRRSAVWWTAECIQVQSELDEACLAAVKAWCLEPTEEHRAPCGVAAEAAQNSTAAKAAWAAFYTSGSITPEGAPELPPTPTMTPSMVISALIAAAGEAPDLMSAAAEYVQAAYKIAAGDVPWDYKEDLEDAPSPSGN